MKARHVFVTLGLSLMVGVGIAASGIISRTKEVKPAKAEGEVRLYLDCSGFADWYSASATFKVHTWNSEHDDQYFEATKVADAYYYADVDLATYAANGGGYRFARYSADGTAEWNRGAWNSYADGVKTYYKASGWTDGTWSTDDQTTWSVVGATNGVWAGGDEDINIPLSLRFNDEGLSFYSLSVELTAGSVFKVKNSADEYFGYTKIETGAGSVIATGDVRADGEGDCNITVVNSGTYEVYMKPFAGKFWMQANSAATATAWATSFLSATNTICSTGGEEANHLEALQGIWTAQKESFDSLTLGARNTLIAGTQNETIADAHDRYVHIMTRYAGNLDAFEGWTVSNSSGARAVLQAADTSIVVIIAVTSFAALSAVGVFFLLRKKRNEQ